MRWSETRLDDDETALWQLAALLAAEAAEWQMVLGNAFGSNETMREGLHKTVTVRAD